VAGILECWCVISSHHVAFVLFSHSLWSKCLAVVNVGWSIILEGPRSIGQKSAGWDIQNRASEFRFPCCGRPQCIPQSVFLLCRDSSSLWYSLIYNSFRDSLQQTPKTLKQKHIEIIEIPLWRALTWSAMKCHEVPWSAMKCHEVHMGTVLDGAWGRVTTPASEILGRGERPEGRELACDWTRPPAVGPAFKIRKH